jgi:FkbH-like protein
LTRFCIGATFTAEPLKPVIDFWGRQLDQAFEVHFAPYNQVEQALLDAGGEFAANTAGVNLIAIRIEDFGRDMARVRSNIDHLLEALRSAHFRAPSILCLCPPSRAFQSESVEEIVMLIAANIPGVDFLHYKEIEILYPVEEYEAAGGGELGHIPYTEAYYAALGTALVRRAHALTRPPFKVIALDCDNTLWAGICGEDGPAGVSPRRELQQFMLAQRDAGMLLAMASKNNEPDVLEVFERTPDMPLQLRHFAARRIDWESKADHLAAMARELSVGLDTFILVDDNPKECAEVETSAPEVLTVPLPAEADHFLHHIWAFDHPVVTDEDRKRSSYYELARRFGAEAHGASNLEQFMAGLQLQVRIERLTPERAPRAAQLTQRTNQFNFTAIRRTEADLLRLPECFTVEVSDRFGDYGLVGVMIVDDLAIDTFLLSCRALGRGVEHRMLAFLAEGRSGTIVARLKPSGQNAPARQFLESAGSAWREESNGDLLFRFPAESLRSLAWKPAPVTARAAGSRPATLPRPDYVRIARELSTPAQILSEMRRPIRCVIETSTATERQLAEIWADLLHAPSISASDNFFDLGGHSLLAVLLLGRVHETFGVELSIDDVYSAAVTLSDLAQRIELARIGDPDSPEYASLLREIEAMPEEEARRILAEGEPESGRS